MTIQTTTWEQQLLSLASEAYNSTLTAAVRLRAEVESLSEAYANCKALTAEHSRTFYLASNLLPQAKRQAVRALYAFCRITDDIVDDPGPNPGADLAQWRRRALLTTPSNDDAVALAWADTRTRYQIPQRYAEQLIEGVSADLHRTRYQSFDELAQYAYGVASTVGLMSMHIIGFSGPEAIPYAIKLGVALQMTNILRDVGEDWRNGRVYLPQGELAAFNLSEADISAGKVTANWRAFMRFQIERTRQLYAEAQPGIALLHSDGRLAIAAAAELYQAILQDIEAHDYDVFTRRAYLTAWEKTRRLPKIWWGVKVKN